MFLGSMLDQHALSSKPKSRKHRKVRSPGRRRTEEVGYSGLFTSAEDNLGVYFLNMPSTMHPERRLVVFGSFLRSEIQSSKPNSNLNFMPRSLHLIIKSRLPGAFSSPHVPRYQIASMRWRQW